MVHRHPCVSFASSRLRVRPTARTPPSSQRQSAGSQLQREDLGLESPSYLHSCPFVSIRGSPSPLRFLRVFASSRETNSPQPPSSQRQSADSRLQRADLGLESPSYLHSRFIHVHSASGGVSPLVTALPSVLWLRNQRRAAPSPSGETELSRHPRHATAVDGDSDLPLPHTRDATTLLCSTAHDDN